MNKKMIGETYILHIERLKHSKLAQFLHMLKRRPGHITDTVIQTLLDILKAVEVRFKRTIDHITNLEVVARHIVCMLQKRFARQLKTA